MNIFLLSDYPKIEASMDARLWVEKELEKLSDLAWLFQRTKLKKFRKKQAMLNKDVDSIVFSEFPEANRYLIQKIKSKLCYKENLPWMILLWPKCDFIDGDKK